MPEGDTIHQLARKLGEALAGRRVIAARTPLPGLDAQALVGKRLVETESRGKNLLFHFDGELVLHSHLRMKGSWHVYRPRERWHKPAHLLRLELRFAPRESEGGDALDEGLAAVCFLAPVLRLLPKRELERAHGLEDLGPDLLDEDFDLEAAARRLAERGQGLAIGEAVMQQRILAGVGNVYRSELLFLTRLHPERPTASLSREELVGVVEEARRLLRRNRAGGARVTRVRQGGPRLWVYRRSGEHCLRCDERVEKSRLGQPPRSVYWCPGCQAE